MNVNTSNCCVVFTYGFFFYDDLALYMGTTIFGKFYTLVSFFVTTYAYTILYYLYQFIYYTLYFLCIILLCLYYIVCDWFYIRQAYCRLDWIDGIYE
jgi:hypothetical protein